MENKEEKEIKEETTNDEFGGTFHERDSHAENDIVKEISDSFLDYKLCDERYSTTCTSRCKRWFKTSS